MAGPYQTWTGEALLVFGGHPYQCPPSAHCDPDPFRPEQLEGWLYQPELRS